MSDLISNIPSADATEMMEDGTLVVRVSGAKTVSRVLVMDIDAHVGGGLYYVDKDDEPTGKWINRSFNIRYPEWERYTCSECGKHSYSYDYCPNCGADMRGKNDEDETEVL